MPKTPAIDHDAIRDLAKLLDETGLTEIEIRAGRRVDPRRAPRRRRRSRARARRTRRRRAGRGRRSSRRADRSGAASRASSPRRWSAPPISAPSRAREPFVEVGTPGQGRRDAAHHRGDEDDEPDSRAARRHGHANSGRGRPAGRIRRAADDHRIEANSEWRMANEFASAARIRHSPFAIGTHVRQDPDRQSRRDRAARPARLQGARHRHRRGAFDGRRRRHACAAGRRERLHRPAAGQGQLSQHPGAARGLRDHRRRRGASRLRLSVRKRPLRRDPRRAQSAFHRSASPSISA